MHVYRVAGFSGRTVAFLERRLRPVTAPQAGVIRSLLDDLESDQFQEREAAEQKLRFAKAFILDRPSVARDRLEEIVKSYPKTKAAEEAKELLKTLKK